MASFNAVMVMGRLVADPELRYASSGLPVCDMRLAVNRKYKKPDGQSAERSLFIDVNSWRQQAEFCHQFLKKGREVFVSGELVQNEWVDPEGKKRSKIKITAYTVQFLGGPKMDGDGKAESDDETEAAE